MHTRHDVFSERADRPEQRRRSMVRQELAVNHILTTEEKARRLERMRLAYQRQFIRQLRIDSFLIRQEKRFIPRRRGVVAYHRLAQGQGSSRQSRPASRSQRQASRSTSSDFDPPEATSLTSGGLTHISEILPKALSQLRLVEERRRVTDSKVVSSDC